MNQTSDMRNDTEIRNDTEKDPATLEREIDQTRAQMDQTISALGRKFSPGQLLDEALGMVREHGGEFAANLNNTVKQNPVPVILSTVGIAWMMISNHRPNRSIAYDDDYEHRYDYESTDGDHIADEPGMLAGAGERIAGAGQRIKEGTEATRHKLARSKEALTSRVSKTAGSAQAQARRAREGFDNLLEDQPLILGAVGVALGALIGAMLPATEQEDRLFGPLRDKTMSEVKQRGEESFNQVRESVSRVGESDRQTLSQPEDRTSRTDIRPEKDASAA
jgi:ElaB/YqjD/DUF883 family membrane-anchored ribosome-binding protein